MAGYNKVILLGNLTRDPELRYTSKGMAIAKFGLAVSRTWKSETGESKEDVTFVDIDAFGKQAEVLGQYLKKGRQLFLEGRLRLDQWDDKQTGQKRSKLGVVLEGFQFVGGAPNRGESSGAPEAPRPAASTQNQPAAANSDVPPSEPDAPPTEEDEVPF